MLSIFDTVAARAKFAIKGSLCDLMQQGNIANFHRPSDVNLERSVEGSLELYKCETYKPAFSVERSDLLLQPSRTNIVSFNTNPANPLWLKGSRVTVLSNQIQLPNGDYTGCRIQWSSGNGNTQPLKRTFTLEAGSDYTLSAILKPVNSRFSGTDLLRIYGDGMTTIEVPLSGLNDSQNRWALIERQFKAGGTQPAPIGNQHQVSSYTVQQVQPGVLSIVTDPSRPIAVDAIKGGQIQIGSSFYQITANDSSLGTNVCNISVTPQTLVSDGVTTSSRASIVNAAPKQVTIELYCESPVSLDWGGIQLEQGLFRTSMIYQNQTLHTRAGDTLRFRRSPIQGLKTFGLFMSLNDFAGDGNLYDCGNLTAAITANKLTVTADNVVVSLSDTLPVGRCEIFVQIIEANSSLSIYINGVLKGRSTIANFRGNLTAPMVLTSRGRRTIDEIAVFDTVFTEGAGSVGSLATGEVADLFAADSIIGPDLISKPSPLIALARITIPAVPAPIFRADITTVNTITGAIVVSSASGLTNGNPVIITRGDAIVQRCTITALTGVNLTLSAASNVLVGDILNFGSAELPTYASARFPFDPIDSQTITVVDAPNNKVTVGSVLSYSLGRSIVRTDLNQDVTEAAIVSIDQVGNTLTLETVVGISVGNIISQPLNELLIDPANYQVLITDPVIGVDPARLKSKYKNGVRIQNWNLTAVTVTPAIRINL